MFVEALPLIHREQNLGILEIYTKFEEHSFERELQKQITYVNDLKHIVKNIVEY